MKPPVRSWTDRITRRCPTQCAGVSTCPYIIVAEVRRPSSCAVADDLDPHRGGQLALGQHPAHVVVEDLGRGAGQRVDARLLGPDQPLPDRHAGPRRAVHHLHRGERMDVKIWAAPLYFGSDFEICRSRQIGVDASLHAHLGGAGLPRLGRTVADLLEREGVRVGVGAALGEGAEPAAGVADVGEVDVAGDDVGDVVADDLAAQRVGDPGQRLQVGAVRAEQGDGLGVGEGGRVAFGLAEGGGDLAGREHGGSGSGWDGGSGGAAPIGAAEDPAGAAPIGRQSPAGAVPAGEPGAWAAGRSRARSAISFQSP